MNPTQVALYARVSSAQQADAHTVASQVAALRERVAADGLTVSEAMQQFPESDKTQSSPCYPDCLFVNLHATMPLSRKSFAPCTWGFLCRWPLPKAANISPPMRSFAWFETALPASWMIALKLRGFL